MTQRRFWVTALGREGRFVYKGHPDGNFQIDADTAKRFGMKPPDPYPQPPAPYVEPDYEAEEETSAKALAEPPADKAIHAPPENKGPRSISPRPRRRKL